MSAVGHAIYLHGFASSPVSSKAVRFERELARHGVSFGCPDFNRPSFEDLTVTRMLDQTRAAVRAAVRGPVALIGSSLGAFVALQAAAQNAAAGDRPVIDRLVLLAPAIDVLAGPQDADIGQWRRDGRLRIFHHAWNEYRDVGFALYQDAEQYDAFNLVLPLSMLVFQGRQDDSLSSELVERWARARPNVDLRMVDDGHQLSASIDEVWTASEKFFGLGPLS
ncbi:MAG TPA: YqiA/YcfP family alpha/beta fold hydrolase [Vicinamibacterales bacterium]|nr:YqiA/YcfP family alpha/beta fold hydrolase [Vicinamibacterales bacterium]